MCFKQSVTKALLLLAVALSYHHMLAQVTPEARLTKYGMSDGSVIRGISDNGKWAVAYGSNGATSEYSYPHTTIRRPSNGSDWKLHLAIPVAV